jgi:hypothetical protein
VFVTVAGQGATESRPVALFVVGVARSGTSALARVLSLCGGGLPPALVGDMPDNPRGHWEPREANIINERILRRHSTSGFDPTLRMQEKGAFDAAEKAACIAEIREFLATLPAAPFVVIKDPRISLLSNLWFEAARLSGFDVATVVSLRHPSEVVASVAAQSSITAALSSALWLKVNLVAEADTRDVPRVFVEYANLVEDWRAEMKRISLALGVNLDNRDEDAIEEFLSPGLRRQRHAGPVTDLFGANWISTVYETLGAAARDQPWEQSTMDDVFSAYRTTEHDFRAMFEGYQQVEKANRFFRPPVMKAIYKVRAIASRQKETWA